MVKVAEIKHLDAFEFYYSLGSARTYEQVAQEFNKSEKTIRNWGYVEKWAEEIKLRDLEALKEARRKSVKERVSKSIKYQKIIDASIGKYIEGLKNGEVIINSVSDLERLFKLDAYLDGYINAAVTEQIEEIEPPSQIEQVEVDLAPVLLIEKPEGV